MSRLCAILLPSVPCDQDFFAQIHIFTNPAAQNKSRHGLNLAHWLAYLMHEQKKATEKVVVLHISNQHFTHNYITNKQKKIRYFGFQRGPPP